MAPSRVTTEEGEGERFMCDSVRGMDGGGEALSELNSPSQKSMSTSVVCEKKVRGLPIFEDWQYSDHITRYIIAAFLFRSMISELLCFGKVKVRR
jgi:hypothetical protein